MKAKMCPQNRGNSNHPLVKDTAKRLRQAETTLRGRLEKLFHFVRDDIRFAFPKDGDFVKASDTIKLGYGQCNTKATLLLALCKAVGIPARIHFSLITKDIQRGFFTGIAYWLMPKEISHSWIEVEVDGTWRRIDTFINDLPLFTAAKEEVKRRGWSVGYSVALKDGETSAGFDLDNEAFQQMAAVTDDHGTWDDPSAYYESAKYKNRPDGLRMLFYRHLIGGINRRVERLRHEKFNWQQSCQPSLRLFGTMFFSRTSCALLPKGCRRFNQSSRGRFPNAGQQGGIGCESCCLAWCQSGGKTSASSSCRIGAIYTGCERMVVTG